MAEKIRYKKGLKQTYINLPEKLDNALYFCTDSKELFKGNDLYTDGLRLVADFSALPAFNQAADGKLYICEDTGNGYVLNAERSAWKQVIFGVDGDTIEVNEQGLLAVKAVPISQISGLTDELTRIENIAVAGGSVATKEQAGTVKPGAEFNVGEDGTLSLNAVEISKISGLEERLSAVEAVAIGGVRYCGAVDTVEELPVDAKQGDLYEVRSDASEWCFNGEKWFEYGKSVDIDLTPFATKEEVKAISELKKYEVTSKPIGTLVSYTDEEVRVMCPVNTAWELQQSGEGADANAYYIGFKAYAPEGAVSFKEDLGQIIEDETMYSFVDNPTAGTDKYGRNYSIVWLPVAKYDEASDAWTYYGYGSTAEKFIGWYYSVEWYNENGVKIDADTIKINLSNEECHLSATPYYVTQLENALASVEEAYTWSDM